MQMEINENPGKKDSQVETKRDANNVKYIEVVPSLPTYHLEDIEVTKILKFLFNPETMKCEKMVVEYTLGFCHIVDYEYNLEEFSTLSLNASVMPDYGIVDLFIYCDFDIELTERQLAVWGISKVYLAHDPDKIATVHSMLEGLLMCLENGTPEQTKVICEDGHSETIHNMFSCYKTDKILEFLKSKQ